MGGWEDGRMGGWEGEREGGRGAGGVRRTKPGEQMWGPSKCEATAAKVGCGAHGGRRLHDASEVGGSEDHGGAWVSEGGACTKHLNEVATATARRPGWGCGGTATARRPEWSCVLGPSRSCPKRLTYDVHGPSSGAAFSLVDLDLQRRLTAPCGPPSSLARHGATGVGYRHGRAGLPHGAFQRGNELRTRYASAGGCGCCRL